MPKKGKTTVRSGFLPFLWNLSHLSTGRGSPPSLKRRWLTDTVSLGGSRADGAVEIEISTSRELPFRTRKRETPRACRAEAFRDLRKR